MSGHAGVLLAANNWLDGDDGFKHTDPDPHQQSDRHRAWCILSSPSTYIAVECVPRGTTSQATRRFRRLSAVLRLRMAPWTMLRALSATTSSPGSSPAEIQLGLLTVRAAAVLSLCCRPRVARRYPVPPRTRKLWERHVRTLRTQLSAISMCRLLHVNCFSEGRVTVRTKIS